MLMVSGLEGRGERNNLNVRLEDEDGGEKGRKNGYGNVPFHDSLKRFSTPFSFPIKTFSFFFQRM